MSIALMTGVWRLDIPSGQKMVLLALADWSNDQGECYPSISTMSKKCSMGDRTVQNHIQWLESNGYLQREIRQGRSTNYQLNPRIICTPAEFTPPQNLHPTPADSAPPPPQNLHPTPADSAPIYIKDTSIDTLEIQSEKPRVATKPAKPKKQKTDEITFSSFIEKCRTENIEPIPAEHSVIRWAKAVGIPEEWIVVAWHEFKRRHIDTSKTQRSWPQTFENYCRRGWLELWASNRDGEFYLTTAGKMAINELMATQQ